MSGTLWAVTPLGASTDDELVTSGAFRAWIAVAAFASVAFVDTLLAGIRELGSQRLSSSQLSLRDYAWFYVGFAVVAVGALALFGRGGPPVDVQVFPVIARALLLLGAAAAGPWVISVWVLHGVLSQHRAVIATLPTAQDAETDTSALDHELIVLLDVRKGIVAAVVRLLVLVLGATLLSGTLHAAVVPRFIPEAEFPPTAVLAYGAFFTVMLSLAVVPLMLSWRQTARALLDRAYPPAVVTSEEDAAARERVTQTLDLHGSLFTFPLTIGGLLAPLATSVLSVAIPQLGG